MAVGGEGGALEFLGRGEQAFSVIAVEAGTVCKVPPRGQGFIMIVGISRKRSRGGFVWC